MYDLIGDIHGHANALEALLIGMGYTRRGIGFSHPSRRAIFLGDFLDRGPEIGRVLAIVRAMLESGSALAVMGNHELNALAFQTPRPGSPGEYLRPRTASNVRQHQATLDQLPPGELLAHLAWLRELPLWLELDGLRVVHACWDERCRAVVAAGLATHGGLNEGFLADAYSPGCSLHEAVEVLLKGKEARLPAGVSFRDADGHERTSIRTRWYLPATRQTYRTYALQTAPIECDEPVGETVVRAASPYPAGEKPAFVGHYWLNAPAPFLLTSNVACLDFSVAKGGFLCAYRWDGERELVDDHFFRA